VKSRFFLNVVIRKRTAILELLASEDKTLLVRRNTLLILDLGLHGFNAVRRLDIEGDRLAGESLNKDLHASTETQYKVESRLLLDVIVREGTAILELLASKDESLLVGRDTVQAYQPCLFHYSPTPLTLPCPESWS
jgi:hypothetical protein